jgi:parvulin-like peptidyl-prolyl isomerase
MKLYLLALLFAVAAFSAGCGGGSTASLSSDDVAVVGGQQITKADFNDELHQAQLSMKSQHQAIPKPGTTNYTTLRNNVMAVVVQNAEFAEQAQKLGVAPTDKDIQKELDQIKQQYFGGSQAKYLQSVKAQGYTDAEVREQIKDQLTSQNLFNKVTASITPSSSAIKKYYAAHLSQYVTTQRDVEEILVGKNKQSLATEIYNEVKGGADFAALAKKYSQDPGSKDKGGKFTAKKGSDVANFDSAVFSPTAKTGVVIKPVNTPEYGWFVIKPLAAAKTTTTPEKSVASTISSQLKQQDQNTDMTKWVQGIAKTYCSGKITYQAGYKPNPDPCTSLTTAAPTTT